MVVAVSSTAIVRRGALTRPALTAGEAPAPRPWTAALQRPAAKIVVAGGLTLAGWLLTGALTGSTATAETTTACQPAATSTVEHKGLLLGHHRTSHRDTGAATCAPQPESAAEKTAAQQDDETPAAQQQEATAKTQSTTDSGTADTTEKPAAKKTTQSGGLLGGLVGSVLNVVGGTLNTVTSTVGAVTTTLSHTVLAPLTQPPADNPGASPVLPLDDILNPILNGGSNSGGVTVTLPATVTGSVTQVATPAVTEPAAAQPAAGAAQQQTSRVVVVHLIEHQNTLPAQQEQQPRDSGVHARNGGGDSTPGLPGGTSAPSAPAPTAAPGHDGPNGARHPFAVHTDNVTTTQLKLIGASRDHDVDGAGREAALPTTSPD